MWSLHIYCGCTGCRGLHSQTQGRQRLSLGHETRTKGGTTVTDLQRSSCLLWQWAFYVRGIAWDCLSSYRVIFATLYIPEKELRLLPTELFLLKQAAFQVQLKWEVFSLDWLASELHGARSHLKMYVHVLYGCHSRGISKQENKKPRNNLRLKNFIQNVCDILLHMAQNWNF